VLAFNEPLGRKSKVRPTVDLAAFDAVPERGAQIEEMSIEETATLLAIRP
jgi:hypothetical protein